jgi:tryptophanyl-tRNA synthetase
MKTILTGIKPTGTPHIANYFGAILPALEGAKTDGKSFFFIADYHALTTVKNPVEMQNNIKEIVCTWLACGLDPKKTVLYRQSDVPEIFELATILGNVTAKGLMDRAHAYKAATQAGENVNIGLYTYPILMAADILLFNTNFVPVGQDQKQHIEIAADIANSFNAIYGKVLTVPEPQIRKDVAIIPGLDGQKMSKSYGNIIPLFADAGNLQRCIKRITTDSSAPTDTKPADHLIFKLFELFGKKDVPTNVGWGQLKQELIEVADAYIKPMRAKYFQYMSNYDEVEKILADGAKKARAVAKETLARVKKAIGV